ncbi:tripartite tricarboxylate transporter TctB family protein [Oribacterium sp. WCC10]|uniref:tripartite tricarboxylate transporter TctB family protein n=1 Tax=Oribacterium sp. WCC10 TaxID=1855343 RepID=UPI0008F20E3E|nr:tripartite tricarboxylate transporter TctB family protein [Oribacterium sp. WCC10]SFG53228.1 Tripartite tricarboxylate transporter TctB family protein [Oribacterium sp. WCC10]
MDIIFSAFLIIAGIGLFSMIGADPSAAASETELGAAFWPQIVLTIMIVLSVVNIVTALKKMKAEGKTITSEIDVAGFFKSKLFIGMIAVAVLALVLPTIGFVPSCILFLIGYGVLLKAPDIPKLAIAAVLITIVIYILFQGALDIMLPRGTGVFRELALVFERILPF